MPRWRSRPSQSGRPLASTRAGRAASGMSGASAQRQDKLLGVALVALAAGLAVVALLGPLTGGPIEYHVGETLRNQTIGLDAASLFVVAPLALAAAVLALRGHIGG